MMTTRETAQALGVNERAIYRVLKKSGARWTQTRDRLTGTYLFDAEDVLWLARVLKVRQLGYLRATLAPETCDHASSHAYATHGRA